MSHCLDCESLRTKVSFSFVWDYKTDPDTRVSHILAVRPVASKKPICAPWFDTEFEESNQCLRLTTKQAA